MVGFHVSSMAGPAPESALDILAATFSRSAQVLKMVRNFLTFMQPYWPLAFFTSRAPLIL
jgi:hypothetical protein